MKALFDVLHLLAHLFDQHFHVHADARELQRCRLGAQRVGLAVQFLDQKVQAFADFAALLEQALDFIDMRLQARDLFSHVDADGKRGGL